MNRYPAWTLAAAIALFTAASLAAETPELRMEPYEFVANDGTRVAAEMGRFTVPENRQRPEGRSLELAFVRFPCTGESCGPPIVYLAGGPGGSGIGTARFGRFPLFMALREHGDVIAFDQRGTGESKNGLDCEQAYFLPLDQPLDPLQAGPVAAAAARACYDRLSAAGHDLGAYNTLENAADLADLRRVLGADKLVLWGISYGSHLGLAMLEHHGEIVDRVILAGIEPLHHSFKLPSDQQALLERIAELAEADPAVSARMPDLLASIRRILERLDKEPARLKLTHPMNGMEHEVAVGRFDAQTALAGMLRGPDRFAGMPDTVARWEEGDFTSLAMRAGQFRMGRMRGMMGLAMDCASGMDWSWARRIAAEAPDTLLGDAINFPFPDLCDGMPVPDLGAGFRAPVESEAPALLVSGTLDGRTPPANAEEILPGLPNAKHLVIDGSGHDVFLSSPKVLEAMQTFLRGEPLPFERIELPPMQFLTPRKVMKVPAETLARYAGTYRISEKESRRVILAGEQLYTRRGEGQVLPIFPTSETAFFYDGSSTHLDFLLGEGGAVEGMVMYQEAGAAGERANKVD